MTPCPHCNTPIPNSYECLCLNWRRAMAEGTMKEAKNLLLRDYFDLHIRRHRQQAKKDRRGDILVGVLFTALIYGVVRYFSQ